MKEFEISDEELQSLIVSQIEASLPTERDVLINQAMQYGFSELQYYRGVRNIHQLRAEMSQTKSDLKKDLELRSELFTQIAITPIHQRRMQRIISDNDFIIGGADGESEILSVHRYFPGVHFLIQSEGEKEPSSQTLLLGVASEVGVIDNNGYYDQLLPAAFRVINLQDHGATLDEANAIITRYRQEPQIGE